jgi:hypothetical protein
MQKKESVNLTNLQLIQLKWSTVEQKKKDWISLESMGHHQMDRYMHHRNPKKKREIIQRNNDQNFPKSDGRQNDD